MKSVFGDDEVLSLKDFLTSKEVVFIIYPLIAVVIGLVLYDSYIFWPDQIAKEKAEKSLIDSSSCQQLGKWIIDNAMDNSGKYASKNYVYAQAKYLVCTHGGNQP